MGLNHSQTLSEKHPKIMATLLSFSFALVPPCLGSTRSVSLGWQLSSTQRGHVRLRICVSNTRALGSCLSNAFALLSFPQIHNS